jgi:hypothetical protein
MSGIVSGPSGAGGVNVLWQIGAGQPLSDRVVADVRELTQALCQAEGLQYGAVKADADARIPFLYALQGGAGSKGSLCHHRHGQSTTTTGVAKILAQLLEQATNVRRGVMRCRHMEASYSRIGVYVSRRLHSCQEVVAPSRDTEYLVIVPRVNLSNLLF